MPKGVGSHAVSAVSSVGGATRHLIFVLIACDSNFAPVPTDMILLVALHSDSSLYYFIVIMIMLIIRNAYQKISI